MNLLRFALLVSVALLALSVVSTGQENSAPAKPPAAKKAPVTEQIQGVNITDPYRWLEDSSDPEVQKFDHQQFEYTEAVLGAQPQRSMVHDRLSQLLTIGSVDAPDVAGDHYFYTRREGTQNQPVLYVRDGVNGTDRVLLDVNKLASDATVALDWYYPSHDGKYLAYGTSPRGSEISTLHVIETATGKQLAENIDRTRAASIAWLKDDSGFYYSKYPRPGDVAAGGEMYNRHLFFHQLGQNTDGRADKMIFGEGRDPQEWPSVSLSEDDRWMVVHAEQGWSKSEVFLKDRKNENAQLTRITSGKEALYGVQAYKGDLYIVTNEDAPRFRLLKVSAASPAREDWKEIIPQSDSVLKEARVVGGKLFVLYEKDASSQVHTYTLDGKHIKQIALPALGSVGGLSGSWDNNNGFFAFTSYAYPPSVYRVDMSNANSSSWATVKSDIRPDAYDVKQVFYKSKDGTKVPMFIVAKKGIKLDGANPTLLYGYGGFNISSTPTFFSWLHLWLEHGGVFAEANLRGGSEYGEQWHKAGMLGNKQNVFDDFIAAGEYLIAEKYTSKEHLAIYGRSNGGLLTGAALTQRPDLFRAVVCGVPLLDMLRYQKFQIAKLWIPEYGTADDPTQFKWLYAYSPYHHVKQGTLYPATLFFASEGDTRVDPLHARKMTALLQAEASNGSDRPILLRVEEKAGHGVGKPVSIQINEWTDIFTFLFWQMGVK